MRGSRFLPSLALAAVAAGCAPGYVVTERGPQAYYQTGYPIRDTSAELERILRSVKRTQVTGYYQTFRFALADSITGPDVRQRNTYRRAIERFNFDHTKTGTATIVWVGSNRATLVTNHHVTTLPDTIVVYHREPVSAGAVSRGGPYVESVSILTSDRYLVVGAPDNRPFTVVARDSTADVAVLSVDLSDAAVPGSVAVLPIRPGDAARLSWGSFVYVLGYPRGFQMVTRGIVSDPNRSRDHGFLLDGLFNRGISGGLIVAVRGDTNELEWVGLATSTSAEVDYALVPEARALEEENLPVPYEGRLYLQRASRIDYGITFAAPVAAVQRLLRQAGIPLAVSPPPRD
jgi:S1-C subfamily serine protease